MAIQKQSKCILQNWSKAWICLRIYLCVAQALSSSIHYLKPFESFWCQNFSLALCRLYFDVWTTLRNKFANYNSNSVQPGARLLNFSVARDTQLVCIWIDAEIKWHWIWGGLFYQYFNSCCLVKRIWDWSLGGSGHLERSWGKSNKGQNMLISRFYNHLRHSFLHPSQYEWHWNISIYNTS